MDSYKFEISLQKKLDNLPYEKHLDDGRYNDGQLTGFELGARWCREFLESENESKAFAIHNFSNCPYELEPVLAKIEHINLLGKSTWYEVVYYDGHWRRYAGSSTFKDGEKVVNWRYCKDCC